MDRTKALQAGYTESNVASSVLNTLSGSFQITPLFQVNWENGVNYNLVAQRDESTWDSNRIIGGFRNRGIQERGIR